MNKKQLIVKLSGALNLSKADAERTFDTVPGWPSMTHICAIFGHFGFSVTFTGKNV